MIQDVTNVYTLSAIELRFDKLTINKVRYRAIVEETSFNLYIFKWRVPQPAPNAVSVRLFRVDNQVDRRLFRNSDAGPTRNGNPIKAILDRGEKHTETIRYDLPDDEPDPEIGRTYVPLDLLTEPAPRSIAIRVDWLGSVGVEKREAPKLQSGMMTRLRWSALHYRAEKGTFCFFEK